MVSLYRRSTSVIAIKDFLEMNLWIALERGKEITRFMTSQVTDIQWTLNMFGDIVSL